MSSDDDRDDGDDDDCHGKPVLMCRNRYLKDLIGFRDILAIITYEYPLLAKRGYFYS